MAKITLEDILSFDIRVGKNEERLRTALTKTKWLERFSQKELNIEILEKVYRKAAKKYCGSLAYVQSAGDKSWAFMIRNDESGAWIHTVYAITLFEGLAKTILVLYGYFIKEMNFKDEKRGA